MLRHFGQQMKHAVDECVQAQEWFCNDLGSAQREEVFLTIAAGVPTDEYGHDVWIDLPQQAERLRAVLVGHLHVEQNESDVFGSLPIDFDRFLAGRRGQDRNSMSGKGQVQESADVRIVVYYKNCLVGRLRCPSLAGISERHRDNLQRFKKRPRRTKYSN
jgi:hypothetical protein